MWHFDSTWNTVLRSFLLSFPIASPANQHAFLEDTGEFPEMPQKNYNDPHLAVNVLLSE